MRSKRLSRPRAAFVAVAFVLAGCAEVEGLGRFSAVEEAADQPPALDATGGGGASGGNQVAPPDARVESPDAATDASQGDGASDARVGEDVSNPPPPPPQGNLALGAAADATPADPSGAPASYLNDGNLQTAWSPGFACFPSGAMAGYDCTARPVSATITFPVGHTVGRVVVRPPAGTASTGILTAKLTVSGDTGLLSFTEPLNFPATGDATFTFPAYANAVQVSIVILTASTALPTIGEIEIYGS